MLPFSLDCHASDCCPCGAGDAQPGKRRGLARPPCSSRKDGHREEKPFNCRSELEVGSNEAALFHSGCWGTGPGCAQRLGMLHPWQHPRPAGSGALSNLFWAKIAPLGTRWSLGSLPSPSTQGFHHSFYGLRCPLQPGPELLAVMSQCTLQLELPASSNGHNTTLGSLCQHALHSPCSKPTPVTLLPPAP